MRKIMGTLAITALALTACGAPAETSSIQPLVGSAPTSTVTAAPITAAPIEMKATEAAVPGKPYPFGNIGDPEVDDFYLRSVKSAWRGEKPADQQFIDAAALACEQVRDGKEAIAVTGTTEDAIWNNDRLVQFAKQMYCDQGL